MIRAKLERYFLRNRYDYREALLAFGRELSSETDLDRMIGALLDQLIHTLKINRAAVFLPAAKGSFALHKSVGLAAPEQPDLGFLQLLDKPGSPAEKTRAEPAVFWRLRAERAGGTLLAVRRLPDGTALLLSVPGQEPHGGRVGAGRNGGRRASFRRGCGAGGDAHRLSGRRRRECQAV